MSTLVAMSSLGELVIGGGAVWNREEDLGIFRGFGNGYGDGQGRSQDL